MFEEKKDNILKAYIGQISEDKVIKVIRSTYVCPYSGEDPRIGAGAFHMFALKLNGSVYSLTRSGDIFDLIGYVEGIDKFKDQLKCVTGGYLNHYL